jgi:hypothetical protein
MAEEKNVRRKLVTTTPMLKLPANLEELKSYPKIMVVWNNWLLIRWEGLLFLG